MVEVKKLGTYQIGQIHNRGPDLLEISGYHDSNNDIIVSWEGPCSEYVLELKNIENGKTDW